MDVEDENPDDRLVRLGQAIKDELGSRSQGWLAEQLQVDPGHLSRILRGGQAALSLEFVRRVEDVLGLGTGDLLRAGGYVDATCTLTAAIASDPGLTEDQRRVLRSMLRTWASTP